MDEWYYTNGGQQQGPAPLEHLRSWLADGQLLPSELVWREGMPTWIAANQVPELQGSIPVVGGAQAAGFQQQGMAGGAAPSFQMNYYTPMQTAEYAGFWWRFLAAFLDGLIINAPIRVIGAIGEQAFDVRNNGPTPAYWAFATVVFVVGIVAPWLYEAMMTSGPQMATIGKRACGIRVTDMNGQRITFARATGRHFGKILSGCILLVGYIMAAFTERKQALHDIMAGTLVLKGPATQQ